jgi:branched-subunit amino acid ABC-type transport system permease component
MSNAFFMALSFGGVGLSGVVVSGVLQLGWLSSEWSLAGRVYNEYDTIMLASAFMVIILVVTLGLVPSVVRSSRIPPPSSANA